MTLGNDSSAVSGPGDIWKSPGTLAIAPGARIYLGDYFTTDEFESGFRQLGADLNLSQYTVYLIGILDNSPADNPITRGTLALNASTGPLFLGDYDGYSLPYSWQVSALAGVIEQGTITTSDTSALFAEGGTLDGVTLDGTLNTAYSAGFAEIEGGLTLDTDLYLSNSSVSVLYFDDGSTVAVGPLVQAATIHMSGNAELRNLSSQTVTIGRGITISGEGPNSTISGPIDNLGTIEQIGAGQLDADGVLNHGSVLAGNGGGVTLDSDALIDNSPVITPVPWSNSADGTITATQGATLNLYGDWTNRGTITVDSSSTVSLGSHAGEYPAVAGNIWTNSGTLAIAPGATVNLGDDFTSDELDNHFQQLGVHLDLSHYTVTLIGTIDNSPADNPVTGGTLALDQSTGPLFLDGVIDQGTITTRGSDDLVATSNGPTLSGVTLDGKLDMSETYAAVGVMNGLTLNSNLNLSGAGASLIFYDRTGITLAGSGTVYLSGDNASISNYDGEQMMIIGQGITVSGENANSFVSGPIDNLGTVAQGSAGQMTVYDLDNGGTVTVASGGTVSEQGLFSNAGTVTIAAGGTFSTSGGDYIQWAGTTRVDGLLSAANFDLMRGLLTGTGTIQANVTNAATVEPGDPFGTLTIEGNYTQTATGVLLIQIGGPNQYGQLVVTGTATLGGTLDVSLLGWYVPAAGTSFQILSSAQSSGDFTTELGLTLPHHRTLTLVQEEGVVTLTASD